MTDGPDRPDSIHLESSLGYYLAKARSVLVERTDRAVRPLGLTAQQIGVILLLSCGRAKTPYELSRTMSYDSGSMTRMLDRLEKKGLVARSRSETDRRMVKLELTQQGRDAAVQLPQIGAAVLNEQLRGFTDSDLATLIDLLSRFIANGIGDAETEDSDELEAPQEGEVDGQPSIDGAA